MATFPFIPFYNNYYNHFYPHYYKRSGNIQNTPIIEENNPDIIEKNKLKNAEKQNKDKQKRSVKYNSFANINLSALLDSDLNTSIIEILGIKLYLDDLIIIVLLFFLYKEDVQDEILFGILLLLLLS